MPGEDVRTVERVAKIRYAGRDIDFPFQKHIHQLPRDEFLECLVELYFRPTGDGPPRSFGEMLYQRLGKGITEKFLRPYNEKLYATDLDTLDVDAMGRFFPHADIADIIANMRPGATRRTATTRRSRIPRAARSSTSTRCSAICPADAVACGEPVDRDRSRRAHRDARRSARSRIGRVVSSAPLPALARMCGVAHDAGAFTSNKVLVFNLGFDRKGRARRALDVLPRPRARRSIGSAGTTTSSTADRMSLYVEIGAPRRRGVRRRRAARARARRSARARASSPTTSSSPSTTSCSIRRTCHITQALARRDRARCAALLAAHGVHSVGRYGGWTYCSIEDNIVETRALAHPLASWSRLSTFGRARARQPCRRSSPLPATRAITLCYFAAAPRTRRRRCSCSRRRARRRATRSRDVALPPTAGRAVASCGSPAGTISRSQPADQERLCDPTTDTSARRASRRANVFARSLDRLAARRRRAAGAGRHPADRSPLTVGPVTRAPLRRYASIMLAAPAPHARSSRQARDAAHRVIDRELVAGRPDGRRTCDAVGSRHSSATAADGIDGRVRCCPRHDRGLSRRRRGSARSRASGRRRTRHAAISVPIAAASACVPNALPATARPARSSRRRGRSRPRRGDPEVDAPQLVSATVRSWRAARSRSRSCATCRNTTARAPRLVARADLPISVRIGCVSIVAARQRLAADRGSQHLGALRSVERRRIELVEARRAASSVRRRAHRCAAAKPIAAFGRHVDLDPRGLTSLTRYRLVAARQLADQRRARPRSTIGIHLADRDRLARLLRAGLLAEQAIRRGEPGLPPRDLLLRVLLERRARLDLESRPAAGRAAARADHTTRDRSSS